MSEERAGYDLRCRVGAIPPPPPPAERARLARARRDGDGAATPPHFFAGPGPVLPWIAFARRRGRVRLRDGTTARTDWRLRWYLDRVEGADPRVALRRLYDVFLDPRGWVRAGVHFVRVRRLDEADLLVRVVPAGRTACGGGAVGCFSWGGGRPPLAEVGVGYLDDDEAWQTIVGMECCAHPLAMDDGYLRPHQPYVGVLGDWAAAAAVGYRPTATELAAARDWLAGRTDPGLIHEH